MIFWLNDTTDLNLELYQVHENYMVLHMNNIKMAMNCSMTPATGAHTATTCNYIQSRQHNISEGKGSI